MGVQVEGMFDAEFKVDLQLELPNPEVSFLRALLLGGSALLVRETSSSESVYRGEN